MKIAFITLGCKLNFAETATYERGFRAAGLEVVSWREKADIYLINTCTVTETSNKKSRGEIRKVHRINPAARIIVTGCYAQLRPDDIRTIPGVSRVFTSNEKSAVVRETLALAGCCLPGTCPPPDTGRGRGPSLAMGGAGVSEANGVPPKAGLPS